jgi:hypothetical protein
VLALFADDRPCATAKIQKIGAGYDLSTVFDEFKPVDTVSSPLLHGRFTEFLQEERQQTDPSQGGWMMQTGK